MSTLGLLSVSRLYFVPDSYNANGRLLRCLAMPPLSRRLNLVCVDVLSGVSVWVWAVGKGMMNKGREKNYKSSPTNPRREVAGYENPGGFCFGGGSNRRGLHRYVGVLLFAPKV